MHKRVETTHTRAPTHAHTQADPAMQTHTASYVHTQQHPHTDTQIPIMHTQTYTGGKDISNITKNAMHKAHGSTQAVFTLISGSIFIVFYT